MWEDFARQGKGGGEECKRENGKKGEEGILSVFVKDGGVSRKRAGEAEGKRSRSGERRRPSGLSKQTAEQVVHT